MNLPIKLVDLVTLLFICLLVVIIVFIILQRNIKRFKVRNVKDPHFLTCKSIPKELKDAIIRKHTVSHTYMEPPALLASKYQHLKEEKAVSFITRMKAFETSKNLEFAICDFGHRRPLSMKFEEFIETLTKHTDKSMPTNLFKEFYGLYVWAMMDPMKFDNEQLRRINKLINKIIEQLALRKKKIYETIIQHKLDLDENGDIDFVKKPPSNRNNNLASSKKLKDAKEVNFLHSDAQSSESSEKNLNKNNNNSSNSEFSSNSRSKLTSFARNVFSRKGGDNENSEKLLNTSSASSIDRPNSTKISEKLLRKTSVSRGDESGLGGKSKYIEMQEVSFETTPAQSRGSTLNTVKTRSPPPLLLQQEDDNANQTNRWSMTNDSLRSFDSENEEIPLVTNKKSTNHQKKKSGHSIVTVIPNTTAGGGSATQATKPKQAKSIIELEMTKSKSTSSSSSKPTTGAENEGFNETNF